LKERKRMRNGNGLVEFVSEGEVAIGAGRARESGEDLELAGLF